MQFGGEDRVIQHDGVNFRCRLDGREGAPWLVLSNSLMTDLTVWDAQVAEYSQHYCILRYDQRGHGKSEVGTKPLTIEALADDAEALCDVFGVTDAVAAGVSMGAATVLTLAARRPDLVQRVIASDGQAKTAPGGRQTWQERIDFARKEGIDAVVQATLPRWFSPGFLGAGGPDLERAKRMMAATPLDGYVACAQALQDYDLAGRLPAIRQPALLLAGALDGAMPATMRAMQAVMPAARFVEIADAGHLPGFERPTAFNSVVSDFLERSEWH